MHHNYTCASAEGNGSTLSLSCARRVRWTFIGEYMHPLSEKVYIGLSIYTCMTLRRPSEDVTMYCLSVEPPNRDGISIC